VGNGGNNLRILTTGLPGRTQQVRSRLESGIDWAISRKNFFLPV